MNLAPPPSVVKITDDISADGIWKTWFNNLYSIFEELRKGRTIEGALIEVSQSPYTATADDTWLFCNPISADITINLPAGIDWRTFFIKNYSSTGSFNVIIIPNGAETIEYTVSLSLAKGESAQIVYLIDSANWNVV